MHGTSEVGVVLSQWLSVYNWKVIGKAKLETEFEVLLSHSKPLDEQIELAKGILQEQWNIRVEDYAKVRERVAIDFKEASKSID